MARTDPNPETNPTLRNVIQNAKSDGVPKDNIEKMLKKASGGDKDGAVYSEQVYEGFGPDGIPFMVSALTDNIHRTFPSVRTAFHKNGGNLGSSGSVKFLFDHIGVIRVKNEGKSEDELFEAAIEAGATDFNYDEEESEILTEFSDLGKVRDALTGKLEVAKSEPQYRAKDPKMITTQADLDRMEKFIAAVEEAEDVDEVFGGFDVDESLIN